MNKVKLELLFEAYLAYLKTKPPDYGLWIGGRLLYNEIETITADMTEAQTASRFLAAAHDAAKLMPSRDWTLLDALAELPVKLVVTDVYRVVKAEYSLKRIDCQVLQNSVKHITALGHHKNLPIPSEEIITDTIILLRGLNQPRECFPFRSSHLDNLCSFLEFTPDSVANDYLCSKRSQLVCEAVRDVMKENFGKKLVAATGERLRSTTTEQLSDLSFSLLTSHMLWVAQKENLLSILPTIKTSFDFEAKIILFYELYKSAEDALSVTQPEAEFYMKEMAFIQESFAAGSSVQHTQFGSGIVLEKSDENVIIQFNGAERKRLPLLFSVLTGMLSADSDEFRFRLYFSKPILQVRAPLVEIYKKAFALRKELSEGLPALSRLLEMQKVVIDEKQLEIPGWESNSSPTFDWREQQ